MSQAKFISGNISRHIFNMTLPMLIVIFVNLSVILVDTYFVARLGNIPLTAMGFIFPIIETIQGITLGIGIATSTGIGLLLGKKQFQMANEYFAYACIVSMLVVLAIIAVFLPLHNELFKLLGANNQIISFIWAFMKIWLPGLFVYGLVTTINFAMRAHGEIKINSMLYIFISILNLIFAPLFIFGLLGFPKLGIMGSALAGLLARCIVLFLYLYIVFQKKWLALPQKINLKSFSKRFSKVAISASLTNFIPPISMIVSTAMLASISYNAVAAFGIASRIQWFAVIPLLALSGAISSIISQNYGAEIKQRANQTLNLSLLYSLIWGFFIAVVLYLSSHAIMQAFTSNQDIINIGVHYFMIVPISYIGWGMIMMFCSYFNAIAKPFISTAISLSRMIILFIPLAFVLMRFDGYQGIFIALCLSNITAALAAFMVKLYFDSDKQTIVYTH